ncbi:MAG: tRNA pseudouridine(38-40) synthase TruA [Bacteroidetes bacterium]|nr:tRNA pseudouridine(38-40) synthase TruA [Bacteroidota bacterium]MBL6942966.1 tRNA pseudouridine(38-40) synthase TruA [Bacteroidales bacterium]
MQRYFIKLAYNGANYHGWQIQENAHSVQVEIIEKLSVLLNENVSIIGCGRTDTGVHAREFYAHFDVNELKLNTKDLAYKLNNFLPADIAIHNIYRVTPDMHSRFSAVSRTYSYYISLIKNPFSEKTSYYYNCDLDIEAMNKASNFLLDHNDFTSFSKLHTQTATNNCVIQLARFEKINNELVFTITADRFLRNMVRAIVGTLLEIGKGKLESDDINKIIEAKDRSKAGFSVPAHGLFLERIEYP